MKFLILLILLIPFTFAQVVLISSPDNIEIIDLDSNNIISQYTSNESLWEFYQKGSSGYMRVYDDHLFEFFLYKVSLPSLNIESSLSGQYHGLYVLNDGIIVHYQNDSDSTEHLLLYDLDFNFQNVQILVDSNSYVAFDNRFFMIAYELGDVTNTTFQELNVTDLTFKGDVIRIEHYFSHFKYHNDKVYAHYFDFVTPTSGIEELYTNFTSTGVVNDDIDPTSLEYNAHFLTDEYLIVRYFDFHSEESFKVLYLNNLSFVPDVSLIITDNFSSSSTVHDDHLYLTFGNTSVRMYDVPTLELDHVYELPSPVYQIYFLENPEEPEEPDLEHLFTQSDRNLLSALYDCYILGTGCTPHMTPEKFWSFEYREIKEVKN